MRHSADEMGWPGKRRNSGAVLTERCRRVAVAYAMALPMEFLLKLKIVVLYISLPLCMGENHISFQEDLLSHEFGPKTSCLTTQLFGLGATNSLV